MARRTHRHQYVWMSHAEENSVSRINMATGLVEGNPTPVGPAPGGMAFGNRLRYVVNSGDRTLSALDGATGEALGKPLALGARRWAAWTSSTA